MHRLILSTALIVAFAMPSVSPGAVIFFDNESDWLSAVAGGGLVSSSFDTTATNIALANQVGSPPTDGTNLGNTLNFDGVNTGFSFDFKTTAPLGGPALAALSFASVSSPLGGGLSVGGSNDNFKVEFSGESIFAFAFTILNNTSNEDTSTNSEGFFVTSESGSPLGFLAPLPITTSESGTFLGVLSDVAIGRVLSDESETDVDASVTYRDFRFATAAAVPEPSSLTLIGLGALIFIGYGCRRNRKPVE